jgi:transposase/tetratricopeptide (TPR) repeat protein
MYNSQARIRHEVVQYYLANDVSLRKTASMFNITYRTVFKWVKSYKEKGEEGLISTYKRPWNRTNPALEEKIVVMKENDPRLTVRQAKKNLEREGLGVSIKGIWGIWRRHGYAGFSEEHMPNDFTDCSWTREATSKYRRAENLFAHGFTAESAEMLNSITALPKNELILQIPDSLLSIRRQVEKTGLLFGKIPVHSYLKKSRVLYKECLGRNLLYSTLIVGLAETMALSWDGGPLEMMKKVQELRSIFKKSSSYFSYSLFAPRLSLLFSESIAYAKLMKIKEASRIAAICRRLLKRKKKAAPRFLRDIGQLYMQLGDYREAEYWYSKSLGKLGGDEKKITKSLLADIFVSRGEYKKALKIRKSEQLDYWGSHSERLRIQSVWSLVRGMPHKAILLATEALSSLRQEGIRLNIFGCYFTIASAYCSLGEEMKAKRMLYGILPFFAESRLEDVKTIIEILLCHKSPSTNSQLLCEQTLPIVRVAALLRNGQYVRAMKYAEKKGIQSFFQRCVFFFPGSIISLIERGKPIGLPRAMLNLPVFRKEIPVYSVKFLGDLIVHRNQKHLRVKLTPKETAFLIYLANSKRRCISLDKVQENFWPCSENPSRNRTLLLATIRKAINLPSHLLHVRYKKLHSDCYFITDYDEYVEHIAQAKALLRAGEWQYARNEYLAAFSLFRGEPFRKMYDNYSEDMRHMILGQLEEAAKKFAESCEANGELRESLAILRKIAQIVPYSDKIKNHIDNSRIL